MTRRIPVNKIAATLALIGVAALAATSFNDPVTSDDRLIPVSKREGFSFMMVDSGQRQISSGDLRGRWLLVFFGKLHAPDLCSNAFFPISSALARQKSPVQIVLPVFVSIDPVHDTADELASLSRSLYHKFLLTHVLPENASEAGGSFRFSEAPTNESVVKKPAVAAIHLVDPDGREAAEVPCSSTGESIFTLIESAVRNDAADTKNQATSRRELIF